MTRPLALLPHEAKALAAGRLAQVWRPKTLRACPLGLPGDKLVYDGGVLEVVSVRAVRLDEATEEDARAWGCERKPCNPHDFDRDDQTYEAKLARGLGKGEFTEKWQLRRTWDAHFGKRYPYSARPWAWAAEVRAK